MSEELASLSGTPLAPGEGAVKQPPPRELGSLNAEDLLNLINSYVSDFETADNPERLFERAAEAVRLVVGLDIVQVLLWAEGEEKVQARIGEAKSVAARAEAINRVRECKTVYAAPPGSGTKTQLSIEIVAAAPILNRRREVIGALYGERSLRKGGSPRFVTQNEAALLQQIARELSLSLDRLQVRDPLSRMTSFMSEKQASALLDDPSWTEGKEPSVTVLFCDIVGFTRITKEIDTRTLFRWSGAVLDMLTGCLSQHGGTLIDYTGDGLSALWGAPIVQGEQARFACRAAHDMICGLDQINSVHQKAIGHSTRLRIGLNTGKVRAGNIGSARFKKFGAHGTAINLGRRIESAAKVFRCPILVGQKTIDALHLADAADEFATRQLATITVAGVDGQTIDVHELATEPRLQGADGRTLRQDWKDVYEKARMLFETALPENMKEAGHSLGAWRKANDWDIPSLVLLGRIIAAALDEKWKKGDHVLQLTEK